MPLAFIIQKTEATTEQLKQFKLGIISVGWALYSTSQTKQNTRSFQLWKMTNLIHHNESYLDLITNLEVNHMIS